MKNNSTKKQNQLPKQPEFLSICPEQYERIEHYSNRSTIWIKLYADLLRDFDFCKLPDETKWHFVGLMILSTQMFNRFPNDVDFLMQQIGANKKINVELLLQNGFLMPAKRIKTKRKSASTDSDSTDKDKDKEEDKQEDKEEDKDKEEEEDKQEEDKQEEEEKKKEEQDAVCADSEQQDKDAAVAVCTHGNEPKGNYSMETYRLLVQYEQAYGKTVYNPEGLAISFFQKGDVDNRITDLIETDASFRREYEKAKANF